MTSPASTGSSPNWLFSSQVAKAPTTTKAGCDRFGMSSIPKAMAMPSATAA